MRVPLAPVPRGARPQKSSGPSAQDIRDSWVQWVQSKCPRAEPPAAKSGIRLLNNLKPYTPPWGE